MKFYFRILLFLYTCFIFISCGLLGKGGNDGQVRETPPTSYKTDKSIPLGMVYIRDGSFVFGPNDEEIDNSYSATKKDKTIIGFWMDQTEITNDRYRTFVNWVKGNMIYRQILADGGAASFDSIVVDERKMRNVIKNINNRASQEKLTPLAPEEEDKIESSFFLDNYKFKYHVKFLDLQGVANDQKNKIKKPLREYIRKYDCFVYPDTLIWLKDFANSYNEPLTRLYFSSPSYGQYPVVGVTWKQAYAFCHWRTQYLLDYYKKNKIFTEGTFRLPTEAEWEYAARAGRNNIIYPWSGPNTKDFSGRFLANFKPNRGRYSLDGGVSPVKVGSFYANDFGLFDLAGNVAEWTNTAYYEGSYNYLADINPDLQIWAEDDAPQKKKRKIIRGGSWKDISYYMQVGTRSFEYQDEASSSIGFRCVYERGPKAQKILSK